MIVLSSSIRVSPEFVLITLYSYIEGLDRRPGVPFKFDKMIKTHTKFVQDVKYAASGDHFASVGSDYKAFLYDGKTGDVLGEFGGDEHKGSIVSFYVMNGILVAFG